MSMRATASCARRRSTRFVHSRSLPAERDETERVAQAARDLQTDSGPTQSQLPPALAALRQRAQSSPWVQQLTSGPRQCRFSGLYLPHDFLVRIKAKASPHKKSMLTIDELERFSATWGHSQYFPLTARGLYAAITDQTNARAVADCGTWIRPDIVEHCARVLRLRVVSAMHRSHIEYFSHVKSAPPPLAIPKKGSTHSVKPSRLDVIRMEVGGRILRQDAMWHGPSVYLPLPDPRLLPETGQMSWQLSSVLPAAGLQCVISIPPTSREDGCVQPLSVSSESCARSVWRALLSQHNTLGDMNDLQETVLKQSTSWKAFVMPGRPESHSEPTLSMRALEMVYHCLPQLTPASLAISSETSDTNSRAKRRRAKKSANEPVSAPVTEAVEPTAVTCLDADVSYAYSLYRPGHPSAEVDGRANKTVPVYSAQNIFGPAVSSTVIPWLLQTPARSSSSVQYVGVVALPCTVELATQLHRLVAYTNNV